MKIILINVKEVMDFWIDIIGKAIKGHGGIGAEYPKILKKYIEIFGEWIERHKIVVDARTLSFYIKGTKHVWARKVGSIQLWRKLTKNHHKRNGNWEVILF